MSPPYNPRIVVEKTPNALLEKFLSPYLSFQGLEWSKLAENDVEPVLQCVRAAAESDRRLIGVRFRQVHALANSRGTEVLMGAATRALLAGSEAGSDTPALLNYLHNDHGNAERLIAIYGQDLRFCHAFKKWLVWDGRRWAVDETDQARRLGKLAMLEFLQQAVNARNEAAERFARSALDNRRITSLLSMAECEVFVRPADLDTDPYLLNFLNGTVDIRTGELRCHQREDFITKLIHYQYCPDAPCQLWLAFLDQVMGGGPDGGEGLPERARRLTEYLQRALGYSLTGCTIEKAVFVPFGDGDNGKSTMLSTFRQLVEEYPLQNGTAIVVEP